MISKIVPALSSAILVSSVNGGSFTYDRNSIDYVTESPFYTTAITY